MSVESIGEKKNKSYVKNLQSSAQLQKRFLIICNIIKSKLFRIIYKTV